jgi:hypothetical protein
MRAMTDTLDAETMLMFLMEILPDEQERERIISEISRETGLSREKAEIAMRAMYEVLAKNLPQH